VGGPSYDFAFPSMGLDIIMRTTTPDKYLEVQNIRVYVHLRNQ